MTCAHTTVRRKSLQFSCIFSSKFRLIHCRYETNNSEMALLHHQGKYHLPIAQGPHTVGTVDILATNQDQKPLFRLYYPCEATNPFDWHHTWPKWIPHPNYIEGYAQVARGWKPLIRPLVQRIFGRVYMPVLEYASPKPGPFPLLVFSHGLTACRTGYSTVCATIASYGFVVAALEHRDKSACATLSVKEKTETGEWEEEWLLYDKRVFEDLPYRQEQIAHRVAECRRALDTLMDINEGKPVSNYLDPESKFPLTSLKGLMDVNKVALAGHSFGGATTLKALADDGRYKVGIALDAWLYPLKEEHALSDQVVQPILFINMEAFQTLPNLRVMQRFIVQSNEKHEAEQEKEEAAGDSPSVERQVITIRGSVHQNQVDTPFIIPAYLRRLVGAHSLIDPHLAMTINNAAMLVFLHQHLGLNKEPVRSLQDLLNLEAGWLVHGIDTAKL